MVKTALVGAWHVHAGEYANRINRNSDSKIVAVWDDDEARGKEWAERLGVPYFTDYDQLLASDIDAIVVTTATNIHRDIMVKAANAGKHIYTEKVLAITNGDAEAIAEAVKRNGVHFTISFPHEKEAAMLFAKKLIDEGKLGRIVHAVYRNCHTGSIDNWLPAHFYNKEQCGGGAMMDLGAHPMYMLNWLLGTPKYVSSAFTEMSGRGVEDNATSVIEFEGGAIGVSETGFMTWGDPRTLEVSGTDGYLIVQDGSLKYHTRTSGGWMIADTGRDAIHPLDYFVSSVVNNTANDLYGIDEAVKLTKLMSAAYRSAESGRKTEI